MKGIQLRQVRDMLDEMRLSSRYDDNGNIEVVFSATENFVYDIVVIISVTSDRLCFLSFAPDYTPAVDNIYHLANSHNSRCFMPMCVVRGERSVSMEYSFLLDEEVSEEYVRENCVVMTLRSILSSFAELEEKYKNERN